MQEQTPAWRHVLRTLLTVLASLLLIAVFYVAVVMGQPQGSSSQASGTSAEQPLLPPLSAAVRITDEELKKLQETVDLQEFYLTKKDSDHIKAMGSKCHELIYLYSGSTVFYDTLTPLHNKAQRYRKVSVENRSRARESVQEHRAIYEALAARDPELAAQKMLEHTKNARQHVLKG